MSGDDHIDDMEDGPSLTAYHSTFGTVEGRLLGASVNVVEHALIAYFVPPYNENSPSGVRTSRPRTWTR